MDQQSMITEADSSKNKTVTEQWRDVFHNLLPQIISALGLIDLLSIRFVCKNWQSASSKFLPLIESSHCVPWFLMYGEGSQCSLLINQYMLCTIKIPEFDGATCLASKGGWLLLFNHGSLFFFCPFSREKIDLPKCPLLELSDDSEYIAAFSSSPTSQDCTVVVIRRWQQIVLQLYLLCCGDNQWTEHEYLCPLGDLSTIRAATYGEGAFHISDGFFGLVIFDARTKKWRTKAGVSSIKKYDTGALNCKISRLCFWSNNLRENLGLEANVSISICGTLIPQSDGLDELIQNERIEAAHGSKSRQLKGVWIQPRYFQIAPY
ncbi:F-box-like domain superfamily [Sesbania bispinosa]|nr:F-box-like domain superfamily [Sesbania bispinosa]